MSANKKISAFFEELCKSDFKDFKDLIKKHNISEELLINFASWSSEKYQRICLTKNEECELILICWTPNQETAIHNHAGQKCWVNVIKGSFEETIFENKNALEKKRIKEIYTGETTFLSDDLGLHSLKNSSGDLAMTLHLYSEPINECDVFNEETGKSIEREMQNDIDYSTKEFNSDEIKKDLTQFLSITSDLLKDEEENPISKRILASELKTKLDISLNDNPLEEDKYYKTLKEIVLSTPKTSSRLFFNQLFGGRQSKAVLGDLLAVMLNNSMYTYKVGGVQVGIEIEIINKIISIIGYGKEAGGTFPTGGSMSNFNAMLMARDWKDKLSKNEGFSKKLIAYTSEASHYSIEKNAAFIGLGRKNVRKIGTDSSGRMDIAKLKETILKDIEKGFTPFFVNATAGTTVLGAFDPFHEISTISKEFGLWMHIDGAYSGSVIFSKKYNYLISGIEKSDSFSFNPHKMLGTPMTCSIIIVKNKKNLYSSFSNEASYLYQTDEDEYNLGKTSFQCGRRNDALKFWTLWKSVGTIGLEKIVNKQFSLANTAREYVKNHPDYLLYSFKDSISVCFNYKNISADKICTRMYEENKLMVGYGTFKDNEFIRLVTINSSNEEKDILNLFKVIESYG